MNDILDCVRNLYIKHMNQDVSCHFISATENGVFVLEF